jgi:hypothetical protein
MEAKTVSETMENKWVFTENIIRDIFITQHAVAVKTAGVIRQGSFIFTWVCGLTRAMASFLRFLYHTQRRTTVGSTPLGE